MTLKETHSLRIADLISAHHAGMLNLDEQAELDAAILADPMLKHAFEALSNTKQLRADLEVMYAFDPELTIGNFDVQGAKPSNFKLWKRITVAAAVAAITLGVWFFYTGSPIVNRNSDVAYKNDITPGRNTATLTLANGKVISLDTNKTSVIVTDSVKTITMLIASTPRGGTYQVTLPDGTHVWLNADSKISFPSKFSGRQRKILLSGEAYFEVAKVIRLSPSGRDGRRPGRVPFIVESKGQQVEVLGTHFNISAYAGETIKTTLLEGSVRVASLAAQQIVNRQSEIVTLLPNQQSIITGRTGITIKEVNPEDAIAWKNGYFMFNNESLENVMDRIARWYNVKVIYEDPEVKNETVFGTISRFENVSKVLQMLGRADVVRFTIEANTIKIKKKK